MIDHLDVSIATRLARLYGEDAVPALADRLAGLIHRWQDPIAQSLAGDAERPSGAGMGAGGYDQADVVLIAYGDHLQGDDEPPLGTLTRWCLAHLQGRVSTVHVLPFHPSTSYDGYAVTDYLAVEPSLGRWADLADLNTGFNLMFDVVLNHCSARHPWFEQLLDDKAPGRDYFIEADPDTPWLRGVRRARNCPVLHRHETAAGPKHIWTTYSPDLIDLDWREPGVLCEFVQVIFDSVARGARALRLDAFVYVWKTPHTDCVNQPELQEVLRLLQDLLAAVKAESVAILPSITNVTQAQNYAFLSGAEGDRRADFIYHLPLSALLLLALYEHDARTLTGWLEALPDAPSGCAYLNLAASHDGVGLSWLKGLVAPEAITRMGDAATRRGGFVRSRRTQIDGPSVPWEINITYFSACAPEADEPAALHVARFIATQAVVLALRGVPALYFSLFMAGRNDLERVAAAEADPIGMCLERAINRGRFRIESWETAYEDADSDEARVFAALTGLLEVRRTLPAFHPEAAQRVIRWSDQAPLFGLVRTPVEATPTAGAVLCLTNFGPAPIEMPSAEVRRAGAWSADSPIVDAITGATALAEARFTVAPYGTYWLTPAS